ncbi:SAP DNA-binding domain-containing protein, partial [Reticulomyxa filosa]
KKKKKEALTVYPNDRELQQLRAHIDETQHKIESVFKRLWPIELKYLPPLIKPYYLGTHVREADSNKHKDKDKHKQIKGTESASESSPNTATTTSTSTAKQQQQKEEEKEKEKEKEKKRKGNKSELTETKQSQSDEDEKVSAESANIGLLTEEEKQELAALLLAIESLVNDELGSSLSIQCLKIKTLVILQDLQQALTYTTYLMRFHPRHFQLLK